MQHVCVVFVFKFLEDTSPFRGLLIPLFWTFGDVCFEFQKQGGSLLHAFSLVWSSDSPLGRQPQTAERSAWQPSLFDPHTYRRVCKHWWRFQLGLEPMTNQTALYTTRPLHCKVLWRNRINLPLIQVINRFQVDYESEAVAWEHIDFTDNRPCLDLLEANPGIFSLLNEVKIWISSNEFSPLA